MRASFFADTALGVTLSAKNSPRLATPWASGGENKPGALEIGSQALSGMAVAYVRDTQILSAERANGSCWKLTIYRFRGGARASIEMFTFFTVVLHACT